MHPHDQIRNSPHIGRLVYDLLEGYRADVNGAYNFKRLAGGVALLKDYRLDDFLNAESVKSGKTKARWVKAVEEIKEGVFSVRLETISSALLWHAANYGAQYGELEKKISSGNGT